MPHTPGSKLLAVNPDSEALDEVPTLLSVEAEEEFSPVWGTRYCRPEELQAVGDLMALHTRWGVTQHVRLSGVTRSEYRWAYLWGLLLRPQSGNMQAVAALLHHVGRAGLGLGLINKPSAIP